MPEWLKDAVFYEIYPQSFLDTNGDGIGDLEGVIRKLDYIHDLGCNAIWLNPCFDSPFRDGGYDVRDYKKVAPRYGTNEDLVRLFDEAHQRGMKVLLDLVPGHTSDQHEWFKRSCEAEENEYSGRYVWTSHAFEGIAGHPYISGMTERYGSYMLNFFASQPALNYGWGERNEKWMSAVDSPEALATRDAMKDIMCFWLDQGCDGFRVDMADSLVKNDDAQKSNTAAIWRDVRNMLDRQYPQAVMVSEWNNPPQAINAGGFHMDFYLDWGWCANGYNTLLRDYEMGQEDRSYFKSDVQGDIRRFLDEYEPWYEQTKDNGYISLFTCNHDTPRASRTLSQRELKIAWAFILTMPGVPFIYYGDEIGMRFLDVKTKEGGYHRTGSRTPMQWDNSENHGFSKALAQDLYLPVDNAVDAPTVEEQMKDPGSLYHTVKSLITLRHTYSDLQADGSFETVIAEGRKFVYRRGSLLIAVNPGNEDCVYESAAFVGKKIIFTIGKTSVENGVLHMEGSSFAVLA